MRNALKSCAFIPLLALGACGGEPASTLPPQPPMWIVSDADSEITLYPTIHILPNGMKWQSDELTRRLADAEEVWFEIMPGSETDPNLQATMMRLGMAPGSSLSSQLTAAEVTALREAIAPLGMPFEAVDAMRPWLASTLVSVGALVQKGFNPDAGVEKQLQPLVKDKKIRAFESAESQLKMLAAIPEAQQFQMLRDTLGEMDESIDMLNEMARDWSTGDVKDLEEELLSEMKSEMPIVYAAVFTARNENWANQIEIEMKGAGTDFMAVGAGHLVGEDGVPAILKARGYKVERLR
ncbi:TraB/GumN family protein [Litorimonas cladophorae]|nr:TraB/GumN family protein [Litorimonas cladophorae]